MYRGRSKLHSNSVGGMQNIKKTLSMVMDDLQVEMAHLMSHSSKNFKLSYYFDEK